VLLNAYDDAPASNPLKAKVADQIALLHAWDYRWGVSSVATSVAVFWGENVSRRVNGEGRRAGFSTGNLREVYFYKNQLKGRTEREYHPGE
jgi:acyl-homoserine-lactone acylase